MRCVIFGSACADNWIVALEDAGETWSAAQAADVDSAVALLRAGRADVLILGSAPAAQRLCAALASQPILPPPYLVAEERQAMCCDAVCHPSSMDSLAPVLEQFQQSCRLPVLCLPAMERMTCLSRALLHTLGVPTRLRAMRFLPDMLALCALHPPLAEDLSARLYPLIARRHGITPAAVERSLRLLVESTWNRVPISTLERFFGHSVDPERGKPTNHEFLAQLQQRLLLAAQRWQR